LPPPSANCARDDVPACAADQTYAECTNATNSARQACRSLPDARDIARHGILLAGGGTLLRGLAGLVEADAEITTTVIESALTCVAIGSGLALEHYDQLAAGATGRRGRAAGERN
jgi:actin-like ATPase involved in cell morphogenesis